MWLARRPNRTPATARSWYTHVVSVSLRKHVRVFSGKVSLEALKQNAVLRLEHFNRLQTRLTELVADHVKRGLDDAEAFSELITECEQVHIVSRDENYDAMIAGGDYSKAGIKLIEWDEIPLARLGGFEGVERRKRLKINARVF